MSTPKKHHYVPQLLLRQFSNANGNLYFFDKNRPELKIRETKPKNIFVKRHLYSTKDKMGKVDAGLEHFFAELESMASHIIGKIIATLRDNRKPNLSAAEKRVWDYFLIYQWARVPDFHEQIADVSGISNVIQEEIRKYEEERGKISDEDRNSVATPEGLARIRQNALVMAIGRSKSEAVNALNGRGLKFVTATRPNRGFVIGSFPVLKLTDARSNNIADPSVDVWLPVAHDIIISPHGSRGSEEVFANAPDRFFRFVNESMFRQSTVVASRSKRLLASLSKRST